MNSRWIVVNSVALPGRTAGAGAAAPRYHEYVSVGVVAMLVLLLMAADIARMLLSDD